ncbi:hypothetical protein [Emergencia sp. 1XD21-10]|uniref:hypothetical protein n=1 Tax=Emergencia sp. 1XD21-10 TaxID=2304569 RepID=UPI00137950DE|nr:hypothetical protein [Emergencia sp. 1XD21-10]NCE98402.1 hypothetical protein [Emergencia sp. 1XD21-10]
MADWSEFKVSGVTKETPKNIMLGAGTLYKDLKFDSETSKWAGTIIGATSGGTKLSIKAEILDVEVDGVLVKAKGLTHKIGETATIETNMVELTKDWIKSTVIGADGTSEDERFDVIESKAHIEESDYIKNLGYVGFMADGTPIIAMFDFALCTSGIEVEGKNKENSVIPATFECYADLAEGMTDTLPYHIYVAKKTPTV